MYIDQGLLERGKRMSRFNFEDGLTLEADVDLAKKYPEYGNLIGSINEDLLELSKWDKLFTYLDHLIDIDQSDPVKTAIHDHYNSLLLKFPYLVDYWKNFVTVEYQLHGLNRSVKILQKSLELFPNSIELWLDYLNIIISNNLHNGNDEFVRNLYVKCLDQCGRQFLSHPLWDQYLGWESSKNGENSVEYLSILLKVIKLPLHQYAKYSTKFLELKNNFPMSELIPSSELETLLNGKDAGSFTIDEQTIITDEYFVSVINNTSKMTNQRWSFEQKIHEPNFKILPIPQEELSNWEEYLLFEESQGIHEQIVSLYERCLVPCSMYELFWIRYLKYLIKHGEDDQEIKQIFNKGIRNTPKEIINLRLMYARYMLDQDLTKSFNILLALIDGNLSNEFKVLQDLYPILAKDSNFEQDVDILLQFSFGDYKEDEEQVEEHAAKKRKTVAVPVKDFEEVKLKLLSKVNGDFLKQLISKLNSFENLKSIVLNEKISSTRDIKLKRELFLKFISKSSTSRDVQFWTAFTKFELQQRNSKNLLNIMTYLLNYSQLTQTIQHQLIRKILSFVFKNLDVISNSSSLEIPKILLEIDNNSSFNYKKFSKLRNNISDSTLIKQAGHPGIETEQKPIIVNRLNFFESIDSIPPLPIYRNVEKLSVPIKYPEIEEESF